MKTLLVKKREIIRKWFLIDARGKSLGRLCSRVALILRGKNKSIFTSYLDTGDYVVIINAKEIKFTGKKLKNKIYYRHSGYPGGLKEKTLEEFFKCHPEQVIKKAIKGMLPKNILGRKMYKKLKVYAGSSHPHTASKLEKLEV